MSREDPDALPGSRTTPTTVTVRDETDGDLRRRRLWKIEADLLADAGAVGPELAREGLGHDRDAGIRRPFRRREAAAAHDFDAHQIEVFG